MLSLVVLNFWILGRKLYSNIISLSLCIHIYTHLCIHMSLDGVQVIWGRKNKTFGINLLKKNSNFFTYNGW